MMFITTSNNGFKALPGKGAARPKFGSHVYIDLGQSGKGGSGKFVLADDNGKVVEHLKIPHLSPKGLKGPDEYVSSIANQTAELWKQNIKKGNLPSEDQLESLTITTAGMPSVEGVIPIINEILTEDEKPITGIDFSRLPGMLAGNHVRVHRNLKDHVRVLNDMAGAAARAFELLRTQFKSDERRFLTMIGGGYGGVVLHNDDRNGELIIGLSEPGHTHPDGGPLNMEKAGASVGGVVNIFLDKLPTLSAETKKRLSREKDAKIVTSYAEAKKQIPGLTAEEHERAADSSIDAFLNALITIAEISLMRHESGMISVESGVTKGVKEYLEENSGREPYRSLLKAYDDELCQTAGKEHPGLKSDRSVFEKLILIKLWNRMNEVGQKKFLAYKYDLTPIQIADNTEGAPFLRKGAPTNDRNDRYAIRLDAFKDQP